MTRRKPPPRLRAKPTPPTPARLRLAPDARRRQIVDVAAAMLTEYGAERVEVLAVAQRAGVSRPVVYRLFPTRLALIQAVLDDFEAELSARYQRALVRTMGGPLLEIIAAFIDASCDAIEAKGQGAWHLLYARSLDSEAARLGRAVLERLLSPWLPRVAKLTGLSPSRITLLGDMFVASGRSALDAWLNGAIGRKEAVRLATRSVGALLREFSTGWSS